VKRYNAAKRLGFVLILLLLCVAFAGAQETAETKTNNEPGMVWKWANFAILAVGLGYLIAKNLPPFFRSRTSEIQKGITEAQQIKRDAEKRALEVEAKLQRLGAEIEEFRTQARAEMQQEGERIRQETVKQITHQEHQAQLEIEAAGKAARRQLKDYAAKLALDLAEQRIRARLNASTDAALVDGFIQDLELQEKESRN
jgi:F-type H+-transporting ATPase subunit b